MKGNHVLSLLGALVGLGVTVALAIKCRKKAEEIEDEYEDTAEYPTDYDESEMKKAKVKAYIPLAVSVVATAVMIFAARGGGKKVGKALGAAAVPTVIGGSEVLQNYRKEAQKVLGKKRERELYSAAIAHDPKGIETANKIANARVADPDRLSCYSEEPMLLFYDSVVLNDYFESKMSNVLQARYRLLDKFNTAGRVTTSDWLHYLGLNPNLIHDLRGWEKVNPYDVLDIRMSQTVLDNDGAVITELYPTIECYDFT